MNRCVEEFRDLLKNPIGHCGITVGLFEPNNYYHWRVSLIGPKDSSYVGGLFKLSVRFPNDYPQNPPEVCFLTPIYHLNVNPKAPKAPGEESLGHVCISQLNWWKPHYRMREVLECIFALFYLQNPDSPYGVDKAKEFQDDRPLYEEKIKYFIDKYAKEEFNNVQYSRTENWDFTIPPK